MLENAFTNIPASERIIVALDCGRDEAIKLAEALRGWAKWVKIGMTLYYACGPSIIAAFKQRGYKVFLDLKLHDIPFQIEGAAESAAMTGADMLTMHTLGGVEMLKAGNRGVKKAAKARGENAAATLGITVLTSMDEESLVQIGIDRAPAEQVALLAGVAAEAGISGVVASPQEAAQLREILGPRAYIVTPGIRPAGADKFDQSRVATPAQAFENGASHIVVGRPITRAEDPAAAFDAIVAEIS
ncbi:MAG: orotidine-5'-phosphate decarboxylase [Eggerthellaceae bacterium]|nr:orotidine-5'-phosphate decarboxylase [Eggerthellaceae bacterium]